ncbi:MAG: flagellar basal body-associated FliL family protein [Nitrospirae bacterium]|nr:flagellar basal body-associated FliL family protein [Nitrospirota bacterium]
MNIFLKAFKQLGVIVSVLFILALFSSCSSTSDGKEPDKKVLKPEPVMLTLDPFIMNAGAYTAKKFIKLAVSFEFADPVVAEKAKVKSAILRDIVITLVTQKTFDMLLSPEGKMQLKDEINELSSQMIGDKAVQNVYFTEFLMK